jgi:DNA (cytosine-5)-methyltransferase 1
MIKAIDFFCGAGGLTRGLLDAGVAVTAGIDNDPRLRETYQKNNAPSQFKCADIREVEIRSLRREVGIRRGDIVLYAACTPCQPFSTLNQMHGEDDRKHLLLSFAKLVEESPPDYVLVENVPGLKTAYGRDVYQRFEAVLQRLRFRHRVAEMLDAKDYGVPQTRKRFILIASRHAPIKRPRRSPMVRTVREQIARYPQLREGEESPEFFNHVSRKLTRQHKAIVVAIPKDGGSRQDIRDKRILLECHRNRPNVHKDVFGRMAWDQPAPTLTCRCTDVYCGRFVHPEQDRGISLREAAALQTFPDRYRFYGNSIFEIAGQIGNAVPVKFAERLARVILGSERQATR